MNLSLIESKEEIYHVAVCCGTAMDIISHPDMLYVLVHTAIIGDDRTIKLYLCRSCCFRPGVFMHLEYFSTVRNRRRVMREFVLNRMVRSLAAFKVVARVKRGFELPKDLAEGIIERCSEMIYGTIEDMPF